MTYMKRIAAALLTTAALVTAGGAMAQDGAKVFVVGGKADDPFWAIVKKGVDDAALVVEAHGGSATYLQPQTYDNLGPDAREPRSHRHEPGGRRRSRCRTGCPKRRTRRSRPRSTPAFR